MVIWERFLARFGRPDSRILRRHGARIDILAEDADPDLDTLIDQDARWGSLKTELIDLQKRLNRTRWGLRNIGFPFTVFGGVISGINLLAGLGIPGGNWISVASLGLLGVEVAAFKWVDTWSKEIITLNEETALVFQLTRRTCIDQSPRLRFQRKLENVRRYRLLQKSRSKRWQ